MVGFPRTFHTILGRSCYVKFMVVPNYTYLKLKMSGPHGVITVSTSFQRSSARSSAAAMLQQSSPPATLKEKVAEEAPDMKKSTGLFELVEGTKGVLIDPSSSEGKTVRIGTTLSSK